MLIPLNETVTSCRLRFNQYKIINKMKLAFQLSLFAVVSLLCLVCHAVAEDDDLPSALVDLGTPEDDLVDEALEHEEVAEKCLGIKEKMELAEESGDPIDPKLQKKFDDCVRYLDDLEDEIDGLVDKITSESDD